RRAEAIESYRRAIALRPDFAAAHSNLALVLNDTGDHAAALEHCDRALRLAPMLVEGHMNRAHALRALDRLADAKAALCEALRHQPDRADALIALGSLLRQAGDLPASITAYRGAVRSAPASADGWVGLGNALRSVGQFEEAVDCFRRALAIDPNLAEAYRGLALNGIAATPAEVTRLHAILHREGADRNERVSAGFALGRWFDEQDRIDEAFACYGQANALFRQGEAIAGRRFDADALRTLIDRVRETCTADALRAQPDAGTASELPVFIVGMPRSGTSLVEQILASHSQVFGAGELSDIGRISARLRGEAEADVPLRSPQAARDVAAEHLVRLRSLGAGKARVIDKMPDNIFHLATIALLFPDARVIFAERDPRDTCLSCFFQRFSGSSQLFSYDLADCGRRYREQERLTAHWRAVLPLRTIAMPYEALVADLDVQARRLIEFLGLAWEPACLDFHRTERAVLTASSWQVRQPLYNRSVGRWHVYQSYLGPLLRLLERSEPGRI
ncbi:MAG: sulfotransferase, partial [Acetobacteraceae bacterium]|nr:sulfotransferase [Acetobacteraceae bacterium]